jgi:hypothetical protein
MQYSRLAWQHEHPNEPIEILSEHDSAGWECRKVEIYRDGSMRTAGLAESNGGAQLSLIRRPPDDEVNSEPEFRVLPLTQNEFELAWKQAHEVSRVPAVGEH